MFTTTGSRIVRYYWRRVGIYVAVVCLLVPSRKILAETVKFRIINYITKLEIIPIEDSEGHMIGIYQRRGLALFENGEVATETSWATFDGVKGKGTFQGYSKLNYEDGSTTVSKYKGKMWRIQDGKIRLEEGSGEYFRGTGRFEGITGTMSWTGKRFTPYSKEVGADNLLDVTAIYSIPSK